jgi:hypothetical protein
MHHVVDQQAASRRPSAAPVSVAAATCTGANGGDAAPRAPPPRVAPRTGLAAR